MAGIGSYKAISVHIPGLTPYRYTMANLHRLQHGRAVPVPSKDAPRLRVDRRQLDHFLSLITSPHLVQDLPFGEKNLMLSNGQSIAVPNVIRTLIPQRIVRQYKQYCSDTSFTPFSESTMTRILSEQRLRTQVPSRPRLLCCRGSTRFRRLVYCSKRSFGKGNKQGESKRPTGGAKGRKAIS